MIVAGWRNSPHLLLRRMYLFAAAETVFSADEASSALTAIDDETFCAAVPKLKSCASLLDDGQTSTEAQREEFETRIRAGSPRELYPPEAFANEDDWLVVKNSAVEKRLARLKSTGWPLSAASQAALDEIASRRPEWTHARAIATTLPSGMRAGRDRVDKLNFWPRSRTTLLFLRQCDFSATEPTINGISGGC